MTLTKTTWGLGVLASVLLGYSIYFMLEAEKTNTSDGPAGVLLEGLSDSITDVRQISLVGQEEQVTLTFDSAGWTLAERAGYPANASFVQGLLSGLKQSQRLDPKTNKPKFMERLGLGTRAIIISLENEAGGELANLTTGDQFLAPGGGGIITFAWDERDNRVWTVSSLPQISPNPAYWLRQQVVGLSIYRIKSIDIEITGGPAWQLFRPSPQEQMFSLDTLGPNGVSQPNAETIAYALAEVTLLDVGQESEMELFRVASATYKTFDGLSIVLIFYERDGEIWTTLEASYDEAVLLSDDTPTVMPDAPPDGAAEAEALNALWGGRAYLISVTKIAEILQSREMLVN